MSLSLNRWYPIVFPSRPKPGGIFVTVTDEDPLDVPLDTMVLVLESSPDPSVEKIRMTSQSGLTLALCSNARGCVGGADVPLEIDADIDSSVVWSPDIFPIQDWLVFNPATGMMEFTIHCTLILDPGNVVPCDDAQPETAPPMVFAFPGTEGQKGGPGKTIKIIWRAEL